ncbi:Signal transduction histidine kinase [Bosea lupini]|uniref:histidine kinase n=1 Tax=Bosea lupini TaxID=1036779 RepID=A0A1H7T203_9HYPH|nr:ATP-binding protein [Bosea lupini]SEL78972.1 Signal transduction histidine kinase [Bosea lupini]
MTQQDRSAEQHGTPRWRGELARKYALFVGLAICLALGLNTAIATFFAFSDQRALLVRVQEEQARAAAQRIGAFVADIMGHLDWASQSGASSNSPEERRLDGLRLMRQVPAVLELRQIDPVGREQLLLSRYARDRADGGTDWSADPGFQLALRQGSFYSEVEFRRGSEPHMVLLKRASSPPHWVARATVNLVFIRELVSRLKVGEAGRAYIVTRSGRLIAHPDLRFVLRNTNLAALVSAHEAAGAARAGLSVTDIEGRRVLSVMAPVPALDWNVVIDLPESEAFAPIHASILRSLTVLLVALLVAVLAGIMLSRRLVAPIKALGEGAARIGRGELEARIAIRTGDELQELGEQFNVMAGQLAESRAVLEDKVAERTAALEQALRLASAGQKAAEEATRAKSRFLAVVGHDIRTPLAGVLGVLELIDRRRMSQRDRRLVAMAATSGEALVDLANATLDLSRLEAGTEGLDRRDFDLGPLLGAAVALMRPPAEQKGLVLTLRSPPEGLRLHGDAGKIHRILVNLLRNAISFTEAGKVELGADLQRASAGKGLELTLTVRDTGIGIDPVMQPQIFQDFVQVDPETGRRNGGVGLGLAICSKLAELMGGSISVVSARGQGSTFSVRLPVTAAKAAARPGEVATGQLQTILVVDDDPVTREVARLMVGKAGHKVQAAASGEAALKTLRRRSFDLVLLDMHMTGIDGIETTLAIREITGIAQPRIVALTADVSPETMRRMRAAGLTTILSKPITSAALLQVIGRGSSRGGRSKVVALSADQPVDAAFFGTQRRLIGHERTRQLVLLFATVSGTILTQMQAALPMLDRSELKRLAHQLGSSAGAVGLGQVLALASALERDAAKADREALTAAVEALGLARSDALDALAGLEEAPATADAV